MNLADRISLAIKRLRNLAKASESPGSRQMERSFRGGHSLVHWRAAKGMRKSAPRECWARLRGKASALGLGN